MQLAFLGRNSVSTIELTKICDQNKYPVNSGDFKNGVYCQIVVNICFL